MAKSSARSIFAARLRAERVAAGLTQQALGVSVGLPEDVASTRINRYERAVHDCDLETAHELAKALRIPLASLYADTEDLAHAIKEIAALSVDERNELVLKLRARGQ
ncbi:helix-turn-helix domain-containing protein [Lysobacter sp. P5_B9]